MFFQLENKLLSEESKRNKSYRKTKYALFGIRLYLYTFQFLSNTSSYATACLFRALFLCIDQVFLLYLLTQEALVPSQPYIMSQLGEPHEIYNRQRKSCTSHLSLMSEPHVNENRVVRWWMGKVISVWARTHELGILFSHFVIVTCVHKICQRGLEEEGKQ